MILCLEEMAEAFHNPAKVAASSQAYLDSEINVQLVLYVRRLKDIQVYRFKSNQS